MLLTPFVLPAVVTLGVTLLLFACALHVGNVRRRHKIHAPATTGHRELEVALRVQMNTLENAVLMLPTLWLASFYFGPREAALARTIWVVSRIWYAIAYTAEPRRRGGGFLGGTLAWASLLLMAAWGIGRSAIG